MCCMKFKQQYDLFHRLLPVCGVWALRNIPRFNTALDWMTDPLLFSRSFVFAPQWYGNSTLSQRDSFLPPPVFSVKSSFPCYSAPQRFSGAWGNICQFIIRSVFLQCIQCWNFPLICLFTVWRTALFGAICLSCEAATDKKTISSCFSFPLSGLKYTDRFFMQLFNLWRPVIAAGNSITHLWFQSWLVLQDLRLFLVTNNCSIIIQQTLPEQLFVRIHKRRNWYICL